MKPTIQCNKRLKDEHFHIILKIGKCTKYSSTFPDFNVWINAATSHTILRSPWSTVGVHQCYFLNVATLLQIASFHFGFIKTRAAASDTSCLVDKYNVTNMINGWMEGVQNKADAVLFLLDRNVVMISLLKADNWRISHFEPHSDRVEKNTWFSVTSVLDAALLLPLTSVSWVWSSAIFLSYIIFLSDTMAIKLNRISPSLYLKRETIHFH